ncbi:hypothetical protein V7139_19935 [Neobacillus drentensis]
MKNWYGMITLTLKFEKIQSLENREQHKKRPHLGLEIQFLQVKHPLAE